MQKKNRKIPTYSHTEEEGERKIGREKGGREG